jgi:uncharacterized membrane protein YphA (DoxX/SURF4 family)
VARGSILAAFGLTVRLAAAGVWLVAGAAKLADLEHFRAQVAQYRVLPHGIEAPFAYSLPFVELLLGLYLLVGLLTHAAAAAGSALMLVFLAAQALAWARGLSLDCGCFGSLAHEHVGIGTILRDVALGLPTFALTLRPARTFSLDRRLLGLGDRFALRAGRGQPT